jgi:hypothetical protein
MRSEARRLYRAAYSAFALVIDPVSGRDPKADKSLL